ncbi:GATA zinc finger domain-containing protein 14-like [Rhizophagus irregularis DAOM 181602=DAOM 197198]|nr:GATA zinc finger domain-containing protein 14-like [Rhizophagus irregularis DAOM 181602=DAOM 197198]
MSGKVNQNKTDKNDESSVLKNGEDSSFSQISINDTSNDHIYDPKKEVKEKQKAKTSSSSNKWNTEPFSTYKPYSGTGLSLNPKSFVTVKPFQGSFGSSSIRTSTLKTSRQNDLLDFSSNNLQDDVEPEEQTPISETEQNKIMLQFFQQVQKFYAKGVEPRESRLVDFPVFKGGNQDPVEWIEAFSRTCVANRVSEERAIVLVAFYLKGTALTWYNRQNITFWENDNSPQRSFTHLFKNHFCNPFRISQWKHQLRNRKQKQGETIEEYIAAITELWKRVDPTNKRMELDKIHEFIEGLRPEFVVPVQSAIPQTVKEAMEKAQALETAFSMGMNLSVYSMMPEYLQNMNGGMIPARTNLAMYQPAYLINYFQPESVEKMVEWKISEGITAALSQMRTETKPTNPTPNNNNNNNQNRNNSGCYVCGRTGHITKNCHQRNNQQNNNNRNNNGRDLRNVDCYNCERKGYVSRNCRSPPSNNNNSNNGTNNGFQNNGRLNY